MNRGHFEGYGKINSGLFLRRGRIPRKHNINDMPHQGVVLGAYATGGASAAALTNAYAFGVSGSVAAMRFIATKNCVLTDYYYATANNTGTPTGALTVEVRNASATNNLPGSLIISQAHTPTQNAWNRVTFTTPVAMTANTVYYIIVGDAAGNATNYYRVWQTNGGFAATLGGAENRWWGQVTTANGFATVGSLTAAGNVGILRFADGTYRGMLNNGGGTPASNTLKRGMYIEELEADIEVSGVSVGTGTSWSGVEIFDASQGPRSTPLYQVSCTADNRNQLVVHFPTPFRLRAGKSYRVVLTFSAASSAPGQQGAANTSTLPIEFGNLFENQGGRVFATLETAAGGWSTGLRILGITHYSMVVLGNRIIDPRV